MAKNRVKQRANRKLKMTAYNAIRRIESNSKADIVLK